MADVDGMKSLLACALLLLAASSLRAADLPYDEKADAKADVHQALTRAVGSHHSVLVVFGANWCPDCRVLDATVKQGQTAELVGKNFEVVKVDLGRYDKNVDLATSYGVDVKKGIPTVALLSARGEVVYVTKSSELADARHMGDDGILRFFQKLVADHPPQP